MSVLSATTRRILAAFLILSFAFTVAAQSSETSFKERMGEEEFRAAGLHKLSSDELAALEAWLEGRDIGSEREERDIDSGREDDTERTASAEPDTDQRGFEEKSRRTTIKSRIVDISEGRTGRRTTFKLENGMVWRQDESGTYPMPKTENPEATISPGMFGSWYLSVDGYNRKVRVKRIR